MLIIFHHLTSHPPFPPDSHTTQSRLKLPKSRVGESNPLPALPTFMVRSLAHLLPASSCLHPSVSRLLAYLLLILHLDSQPEGGNLSPHTNRDQPDSSTPEIYQGIPPANTGARSEPLVELVSRLQPLLPSDREWLEEGTIEPAGDFPVNAGGLADILVGMRGSHKVAVKRYRIFSSSDYLPTYTASVLGSSMLSSVLTTNPPTEVLRRGHSLQSAQE